MKKLGIVLLISFVIILLLLVCMGLVLGIQILLGDFSILFWIFVLIFVIYRSLR